MTEQRAKYEIDGTEAQPSEKMLNLSWSQILANLEENADRLASTLDENQARAIVAAIAAKYPKVIEAFQSEANH